MAQLFGSKHSSKQQTRPLVVVIPGIGGSVLSDEHGEPIYRPTCRTLRARNNEPSKRLAIENRLQPTALISRTRICFYHLVPGYDRLLVSLRNALGISERDTVTAGPDLPRPDASLVAFPYDFRQSVDLIAQHLDAEIRARVQGRPVVLVAHSMGGLVAAHWWAFLSEGIEVKEIITLGTPYRGATAALDKLVNGVSVAGFTLDGLSEVLRGWDSGFELLPHWQAVEVGGQDTYPHQLPPELTAATPDFAARAHRSYRANVELSERVAALVEQTGRNPFSVYYSQGRATLSRATLSGGRLQVFKEDPAWLPEGWVAGDGTVPMLSAIPPFLEDDRLFWHRLTRSHQELVEESPVAGHVAGYRAEALPEATRGPVQDSTGSYLRLDLDDVLPALTPTTGRIEVVVGDATDLEVRALGGSIGNQRVSAERDGERWVFQLPGLPEGLHELKLTADTGQDSDPVTLTARIGAVELSG